MEDSECISNVANSVDAEDSTSFGEKNVSDVAIDTTTSLETDETLSAETVKQNLNEIIDESKTVLNDEPPVKQDDTNSCENLNRRNENDESFIIERKPSLVEDYCTIASDYRDKTCWTSDSETDGVLTSSTESSSDTSSSSESSSDSDSDTDDEPETRMTKTGKEPRPNRKKPSGEIGLEDLPPIEDLKISVSVDDIRKLGSVSSIVGELVVIEAAKENPPLNIDSVLFTENGQALGKVFDVFGQVSEPFYSVRFNSPEEITSKGIDVGMEVYMAPNHAQFTEYIFAEQLRKLKGSDASWKHDSEIPVEDQDFSDDEQEKKARCKQRQKNRQNNNSVSKSNNGEKRRQIESRNHWRSAGLSNNLQPPVRHASSPLICTPFQQQYSPSNYYASVPPPNFVSRFPPPPFGSPQMNPFVNVNRRDFAVSPLWLPMPPPPPPVAGHSQNFRSNNAPFSSAPQQSANAATSGNSETSTNSSLYVRQFPPQGFAPK